MQIVTHMNLFFPLTFQAELLIMGKPDMHMRHNSMWGKEAYWIGRECGAKALEPLRCFFFFLSVPNGGASSSQMLRSAFGVNFSWFAQINSAPLLPQKQNQRLLRSQRSRAPPYMRLFVFKSKGLFSVVHMFWDKKEDDKWQLISSLSAQRTDLCLKAPQLQLPLFHLLNRVYPLSGLINIHDILKCFQSEYDYEAW